MAPDPAFTVPYLQAAGGVGVLPGWEAEPVGILDGRPQEVVYNPARFRLIRHIGPVSDDLASTMRGLACEYLASGEDHSIWVQDRAAYITHRLAIFEAPPAPTLSRD